MNTQTEILNAIKYAEEKSEEYIKEKCANQVSFDEIKKKALKESVSDIDYYNKLRNGVIEKVAEYTGESIDAVNEEFIRNYY